MLPVAFSSFYRLAYVESGSSSATTTRSSMRSGILTGALMCLCFMSSSAINIGGTSWRNSGAFTALLDDGTIRSWGDSGHGGGVSTDSDSDKIRAVYSTDAAFTAVFDEDGQAVSWGLPGHGGTAPSPLNLSLIHI